jgi:hypothetical protein
MFYARKHSPLLLTWSQSPDALCERRPPAARQTQPGDPASAAACEAHVRELPGNTPNSTTAVQRNFTGGETFGRVNFIVPSMCHSGHNSDRACGGGPGDPRGGTAGMDRWLELTWTACARTWAETASSS